MRQATRERQRVAALTAAGKPIIEVSCATCRRTIVHENQFEVVRALAIHQQKMHGALSATSRSRIDGHAVFAAPIRGNVIAFNRRFGPSRTNCISATAIAHMIALAPRKQRTAASS